MEMIWYLKKNSAIELKIKEKSKEVITV